MTAPERRVLDWTEIDAAMHKAHELRAEAFHDAFAVAWRWIAGDTEGENKTADAPTEARPCPTC